MTDSYYDIAQVCQNGHVVNSSYRTYPQHNQDYCAKCGAKTITQCPECQTPIRGEYHIPGVIVAGSGTPRPPSFCLKCGHALPWTAARLEAAQELVETFDKLSKDEKQALEKTLTDIIKETPRSEVAKARFKVLIQKAGKEAAEGIRNILVDIVSETVRKTVLGI